MAASLSQLAQRVAELAVRSGSRDPADSPYNYIPTEYVAIIFIVLYGVSTAIHVGQATWFRMWWLFPTVILAGLTECIGWSGRLWSSISPSFQDPFLMQITTTIIAPTPLVAANFIILGRMIRHLGSPYSRLTPRNYTILFCSADFISLIVQGVGGGLASTAASSGNSPAAGGHIMLGGIAFQLFTITIYVFCAVEFFVRYAKDRPCRPPVGEEKLYRGHFALGLKLMTIALIFNTLCLFIRSVYRVIELSDGWSGRIISTQVYFNVLDGAMVTLAIYTLNVAHPGVLISWLDKKSASLDAI